MRTDGGLFSRGPTDDGRVKPDIVAPGAEIASMRTRRYVLNDNMETSFRLTMRSSRPVAARAIVQYAADAPHSPTHYGRATVNAL